MRPVTGPELDNRRVLAALVDLLLVAACGALILFAAGTLGGHGGGGLSPALAAVVVGWALYYYFACESGAGQTLGKRLLGLRVVRADGEAAGLREIVVRTVLRVVDGIGLYLVGLLVMLLTGGRRQRLGDLAAGTVVTQAGPAKESVGEPSEGTAPVAPELHPFAVTEPDPDSSLPDLASPALKELAEDVAAATEERAAKRDEGNAGAAPAGQLSDEPTVEASAGQSAEPDDTVTVKPVDTVSAIDLVMGDEETRDDEARDDHDAARPGPQAPSA
jgi:uncharacterized RDD family membrane protein YckC